MREESLSQSQSCIPRSIRIQQQGEGGTLQQLPLPHPQVRVGYLGWLKGPQPATAYSIHPSSGHKLGSPLLCPCNRCHLFCSRLSCSMWSLPEDTTLHSTHPLHTYVSGQGDRKQFKWFGSCYATVGVEDTTSPGVTAREERMEARQ